MKSENPRRIDGSSSPPSRVLTARDGRRIAAANAWAVGWAVGGAAVWAGLAILARIGIFRVGVIELLFSLGPLVIVPLGMELLRLSGTQESGIVLWLNETAQTLQPVGAVLAILALWLPPGSTAGLLAAGWMVVCAFVAIGGVWELA